MKIKRSGSYYIYQVFNTVVLALVALTCIFPILHVLAMSLSLSLIHIWEPEHVHKMNITCLKTILTILPKNPRK